jgi:hypothetical protein
MVNFKIGSDPEVFLVDSRDRYVSAIDIIEGSKDNPLMTLNGFIQQDNILAEFNSRPASSLEEFINNHDLILQDLSEYVQERGLTYKIIASIKCEDELLSDERALMGGCDPDMDAWTLRMNRTRDLSMTNLRVAGGHLHISVNTPEFSWEDGIDFVRALDLTLGIQSVVHDNTPESKQRKKLYGKAGSYRFKNAATGDPYTGVEYRTLSNYWLKSHELMSVIYKGVEFTINNLPDLVKFANEKSDVIVNIINKSAVKKANNFIKDNSWIYNTWNNLGV